MMTQDLGRRPGPISPIAIQRAAFAAALRRHEWRSSMNTMKLSMIAVAFAALVGCSGTANDMAVPPASATTSDNAAPPSAPPQSPTTAYKPYICDQGGEHNC
jgi:hypothetical protein